MSSRNCLWGHTRVACGVFDGMSFQAGVLTAVSVAPQPQQHCRAIVLQAHLEGPFGLLSGAVALPFLPCMPPYLEKDNSMFETVQGAAW